MRPIAGELDWVDALVLLLIPLSPLVIGYLLLRKAKTVKSRRTGAIMIVVVTTAFGALGLAAYAVPSLDDFRNPAVPIWTALLGNLIMWAICLGAFGLACRAASAAIHVGNPATNEKLKS